MNVYSLAVVCMATLLFQGSYEEEENSTTKRKKYGGSDQLAECPQKCRCSVTVPSQSEFLLRGFPKVLRTVNCSRKSLVDIPSKIPSNTQSLVMIDNEIKDIHYRIPDLMELIKLDMSGNKIQNLGRGIIFKKLKKLKVLVLSKNSFKVLFAKVFSGLISLQELSICNSKLGYIDEYAFERLYQLENLYLSANKLVYIFQEWFQDMDRLKVLDLSKNSIKFVSGSSFVHLSSLFELNLQENAIRGISKFGLDGLPYLRKLMLKGNNLNEVPRSSLRPLKGLKELDLSENPIEKLSEDDISNSSLHVVRMNFMPRLRLISSRSFSFLPEVTSIELNGNKKLIYVDVSAFHEIGEASVTIQMTNCSLQVIPMNITSELTKNTVLDITNNPLRCDCNAKWLLGQLQAKDGDGPVLNIFNKSELRCYEPKKLRDVALVNLNSDQLSDSCAAVAIQLSASVTRVASRKRVSLECRGIGVPKPEIAWVLADGTELNATHSLDRTSVRQDGCLHFEYTMVKDSGRYICIATNTLGRSEASMQLQVTPIDLGIHVNRISATFVSVVWSGTARNSYNIYKLLCKENKSLSPSHVNGSDGEFMVVPISPFDRFYTISNLIPSRVYVICIAIEDGLPATKLIDQIVSCINVTTSDVGLILNHMSQGHSNVAVGVSLGISVLTIIVLTFSYMAAKKYRHGKYKDPTEDGRGEKLSNVSQIQLETLYSPLISSVGPQIQ